MATKVVVVGPNLPHGENKGTFVCHLVGCSDLEKLMKKIRGGDTYSDTIVAESKRAVAEHIYPVGEFEYWDTDPDSYIDDIWFAPCVKLPREPREPSYEERKAQVRREAAIRSYDRDAEVLRRPERGGEADARGG